MRKTSTEIEQRVDGNGGAAETGLAGRVIRGFAIGALTPFRLTSGMREISGALKHAATEEPSARITGAILSAVFLLALGWKWLWLPLIATNAADVYLVVKRRGSARGQA